MTAKDLLHKYLNYDYLWRMHTEDKPSKIRLQQLNILFEVFNISKKNATPSTVSYIVMDNPNSMTREQRLSNFTVLEYFETGEFLHDRPYSTNEEVVNKATSAVGNINKHSIEGRRNEIHLSWLFSDLLSYRKQAYGFAYPPGGMLEGHSVGLYYSFYLQHKLSEAIRSNLEEIDEVLCLLIDPQKRDVPIAELISRFGYPDADLDKIDLDWRIENY